MNPILKHFLPKFLALGLTVGIAALSLSWITSPGSNKENVTASTSSTSVPKNAFVESIPKGPSRAESLVVQPQAQRRERPPRSDNLTENLFHALEEATFGENPDGFLEIDGEVKIALPSDATIGDAFATEVSAFPPSVSGLAGQVSPQELNIVGVSDRETLRTYGESLEEILGEASETQFSQLKGAQTLDKVGAAMLLESVSKTRDDLYQVPVPAEFSIYHSTVVGIFELRRNYLSILTKDPAKALALTDDALEISSDYTRRLHEEAGRLSATVMPSFASSKEDRSLLETLARLTIAPEKAYAVAAIFVPVWDQANTAIELEEEEREWWQILLDEAANYLALRLAEEFMNMALARISGQDYNFGDGFRRKPNFVANLKRFLGRAADAAIGEVFERYIPELCQDLGPLFETALLQGRGPQAGGGCTLTQAVANVQNFKVDFLAGGWRGYTTLLEPGNNFWGSVMKFNDATFRQLVAAREEAQSKVDGGFTGTEKCLVEGEVVGTRALYETDPRTISIGSCDAQGLCNVTICAEYETTTPPSLVASLTSRVLGIPIDQLGDIEGWRPLLRWLAQNGVDLFLNALASEDGVLYASISHSSGSPEDAAAARCAATYPPGSEDYNTCVQNHTNPPIETGDLTPDDFTFSPDVPVGTPGESETFTESGVLLEVTPETIERFLEFPLAVGDYTRAHLEFDVFNGGWNMEAGPTGNHNLFWFVRNRNRDMYGYSFVENPGPADSHLTLRYGVGMPHEEKARVGTRGPIVPEETYHVDYVYDTIAREIILTITRGGTRVAQLTGTPDVQAISIHNPREKIVLGLGGNLPPSEVPTYGWIFSNLRFEFTAGTASGGGPGIPPPPATP